jgi:hypothetical protein
MPMRTDVNTHEVYYQATWHQVDIMVSLLAKDWSVSRALIGADLNGADGWSLSWTPSGLTEDNLYFFRASGLDVSGLHGSEIFLLRYNCSQAYVAGDYDNDGQVGLPDLNYLISFIALGGPAPVGGAGRADANCDNSVNIADVVYYMNYLFGNAATPCY